MMIIRIHLTLYQVSLSVIIFCVVLHVLLLQRPMRWYPEVMTILP